MKITAMKIEKSSDSVQSEIHLSDSSNQVSFAAHLGFMIVTSVFKNRGNFVKSSLQLLR